MKKAKKNKPLAPRKPTWPELRALATEHGVDPRSILKECDEPGSVTGMAGKRAEAAIDAWRKGM